MEPELIAGYICLAAITLEYIAVFVWCLKEKNQNDETP